MKEYKSADIRNFALVGHGASGKTMLAEAMLASSGKIGRMGSIASGNTASDYHEEEQERKISIHSSLIIAEWQDKKFNILDVPGYMDFVGESLSALRVADLAAIVVHAGHGIEVGTEQAFKYATDYNIPKLMIVNALDKEHVNFDEVLSQIKERFGNAVAPLTVPVKAGPGFNQVLDVLNKKVVTYKTDQSGNKEIADATGEFKDQIDQLYAELAESVAESDDALLEKFFESGELTEEEMKKGMHAAIKSGSLIPLLSTAAESNVGVVDVMDFIAKHGLSPLEMPKIKAMNEKDEEVEIAATDSEPLAFVFKTMSGSHVGETLFFRVYSGTIQNGINLYNSNKRVEERIGQTFVFSGKNRDSVSTLHAGDIGAVVKLKNTHTNNTLCSPKKRVKLQEIKYPNSNIHSAIQPKVKGEEEKLAIALSAMHEEDPTFVYTVDSELHQTVISGQGELHLTVVTNRMCRRFGVEIELSKPKIPFRETIKLNGDSKYRHKKQSGGAGQFAEVWMRIEPLNGDGDVEFTHSLVGQNVDRVFVPSVEKGVKTACIKGIMAGYKVVGVKVDFYDGKQHPVDSKDIAFQIAGECAFREAFRAAKPCLLEPIMNVEVKVPEEFMGDVMGGISGMRGRILGMDGEGGFQIIRAEVPQAEMHHYSNTLRSITGGRGMHTEKFCRYEQMPGEIEQKVVAQLQAEKEVAHK
jgi:elongation factor G